MHAMRKLSDDGCLSTNTKYQQLELTVARRLQSANLDKTLIGDNPLASGLCGCNSFAATACFLYSTYVLRDIQENFQLKNKIKIRVDKCNKKDLQYDALLQSLMLSI